VCSGAFVLAAAGLLDGRRATTHWMHAEALAARYPQVEVDPDVLYVDNGDVMTSAGTAAGIDLCLHVVRLDFGADIANAVARRMVVPPHREGGQAQFVEAPVTSGEPGSDRFAATLEYMLEHLDEPLPVEGMAERAAMSPRTFARRFRATTGTTPGQWLVRQRVLLAQRLLEITDDPVELIALRCGFGTAAGLRLHFRRVLATSPLVYRRTFRRIGA
jgi:transcriptional regulator GlxA family with amidase domain